MNKVRQCEDGTVVYDKLPDIGTGLFQVQEASAREGMLDQGPWHTVKRFRSLSEAEEWCKNTPTNWTVRQIFVEPREVPNE